MIKEEKIICEGGLKYHGFLKEGKPHGKGIISVFTDKREDEPLNPVASQVLLEFFAVKKTSQKEKADKKYKFLTTKYVGKFRNGKWHGKFKCTKFFFPPLVAKLPVV